MTPALSLKSQKVVVFPFCWPLTSSAPATWTCQRLGCWSVERLERAKMLDLQIQLSARWPPTSLFFKALPQHFILPRAVCAARLPPRAHMHCAARCVTHRAGKCYHSILHSHTVAITHTPWDVTHLSTYTRHTQWCIIIMKTGKCRILRLHLIIVCVCVCVCVGGKKTDVQEHLDLIKKVWSHCKDIFNHIQLEM